MIDKSRVSFLIVDDDSVAVMAIKRALARQGLANPVNVAGDGQAALDLLRGKGGQSISPPYIILLDINMPRMTGLEFLTELRGDEKLANSVVFVLTTSDAPSDIAAAYGNKIAGYIVKDNACDTVKTAISMLDQYIEVVAFAN